jgi:hypothetical protein
MLGTETVGVPQELVRFVVSGGLTVQVQVVPEFTLLPPMSELTSTRAVRVIVPLPL